MFKIWFNRADCDPPPSGKIRTGTVPAWCTLLLFLQIPQRTAQCSISAAPTTEHVKAALCTESNVHGGARAQYQLATAFHLPLILTCRWPFAASFSASLHAHVRLHSSRMRMPTNQTTST